MFGREAELELIGEALRRPDLVGVILTGAIGSGKSTLLEVAARRAEQQGFDVVRLYANRAISTVPLFVFSCVLDDDAVDAERFVTIRRVLRERSDRRPVLLAIDDAHELDDVSAGLVGQLARERCTCRDLVPHLLKSSRPGTRTQPISSIQLNCGWNTDGTGNRT